MKSILAVFMSAVLCLSLVGCGNGTTSNLITALDAVSASSSVFIATVDLLEASGKISPADATIAANYTTAVSAACNTSITELNSTDTNALKITKITSAFTIVVAPAFSPGVAVALPALEQAVVATIAIFLNNMNSPPVVTAAKVAPAATITLSKADKAMLKKIKTQTAETIALASKLSK